MSYVTAALASTDPDRYAVLADLRTASCLADGVPLEDIHPSSGHEFTKRAYRNVWESWAHHIEAHSPLGDYALAGYHEAYAIWARNRPEYLVDQPWPVLKIG